MGKGIPASLVGVWTTGLGNTRIWLERLLFRVTCHYTVEVVFVNRSMGSVCWLRKNKLTREVIEAYEIYRDKDNYISTPSVSLCKGQRATWVSFFFFFYHIFLVFGVVSLPIGCFGLYGRTNYGFRTLSYALPYILNKFKMTQENITTSSYSIRELFFFLM